MAKQLAFYIDTPEVLEIVSYFNKKVKDCDFIVDLYKNYVIVDPETGNFEITGHKGLIRRFRTDSVLVQSYILTEKE